MIVTPEIKEAIAEEVLDALAEWGTIASVQYSDGKVESLRGLLNSLCDPLINKLCQRLSEMSE